MNIIVCEDSEKQRIDIVKHIDNMIKENYLNMKVYLSTENPYDVIKSVEDTPELSIYILDVDLKCNINGIELADKIILTPAAATLDAAVVGAYAGALYLQAKH